MKILFHLTSIHNKCAMCKNLRMFSNHGTGQKNNYCPIVSSAVEDNYWCSFYEYNSKKDNIINRVKV